MASLTAFLGFFFSFLKSPSAHNHVMGRAPRPEAAQMESETLATGRRVLRSGWFGEWSLVGRRTSRAAQQRLGFDKTSLATAGKTRTSETQPLNGSRGKTGRRPERLADGWAGNSKADPWSCFQWPER